MLGTPSVYLNQLDLGYIDVEESWGLVKNLSKSDNMVFEIEQILLDKNLKKNTRRKKDEIVATLIDPTAFFYWYLSNYPESDRIISSDPDYQYKFR